MAAGIRANFGTMGKPMHVARSSENGVTAALLIAEGFTFNEQALDGQWGYLSVAGRGGEPELVLGRFGKPFIFLGQSQFHFRQLRGSSRHNMVSFFRSALCSLFLFSFDAKSVTIFNHERRLQRPSQNRTCGFPTSGSSVNLTGRAIGCTSCEQCGAAAAGSASGTPRSLR